MTPAIALFAGIGLLLIALAIPLIRRRVPPNDWYGLRVAATFADEWVWYEANARSGRDLLVIGVLQVLMAVTLPAVGVPEAVWTTAGLAASVIAVVAVAVFGVRRANDLLSRRRGAGTAA